MEFRMQPIADVKGSFVRKARHPRYEEHKPLLHTIMELEPGKCVVCDPGPEQALRQLRVHLLMRARRHDIPPIRTRAMKTGELCVMLRGGAMG